MQIQNFQKKERHFIYLLFSWWKTSKYENALFLKTTLTILLKFFPKTQSIMGLKTFKLILGIKLGKFQFRTIEKKVVQFILNHSLNIKNIEINTSFKIPNSQLTLLYTVFFVWVFELLLLRHRIIMIVNVTIM